MNSNEAHTSLVQRAVASCAGTISLGSLSLDAFDLDSLQVLELAAVLQDEFGIGISDDDLPSLSAVCDWDSLAALVEAWIRDTQADVSAG
jgi:acyl carrier protein